MSTQHERLAAATAHLPAPVAVVDLGAFDANAADLVRRAGGKPIRVASKSVRVRSLLRRALARPGYAGILGFTVAEALWLAEEHDDVVVGYPSAEREALARLAASEELASRVTIMVDDVAQLDLVQRPAGGGPEVRVCLDLDASLPGPWPAPRAAALAGARRRRGPRPRARGVARPGFRLVGLMAYEGQVAGQADRPPGKRLQVPAIAAMKALSVRQVAERRAEVVEAISGIAELELVNGGGTGSLETTAREAAVTEVAAGSGLFAPTLFDGYRRFTPAPAALFALDVTRVPAPGIVTVAGGGWIASGPAGADRVPTPTYPPGLSLLPLEGAGEVQTPLRGADGLAIGDRVWFRHAKAGELCERVDVVHLVEGDQVVDSVPTYRGEGKTFL